MKKITRILFLIVILLPLSLLAQNTIIGTVIDNDGFPLPGATVLEKNVTNGTTTDFDGNFQLTLKESGATISVSFVGFKTKEIFVGDEKNISIQLDLSSEALDEVIVIGYGSSSKSDITAAITTVKPVTDDKAGVAVVESLLRGTSGLNVLSSGEPGAAVSINIRGVSSLTGSNQPLYVIDGIVMDSAEESVSDALNFRSAPKSGIGGVAPEDIESIQVLKDASATAIYGSLGANGVILITTKQGSLGTPVFTISTSTTVGKVNLPYELLDTEEYVAFTNDKYQEKNNRPTSTQDGTFFLYPEGEAPFVLRDDGLYNFFQTSNKPLIPNNLIGVYEPMNWTDLYRPTYSTNTRFTASGGTEKTKYYGALGYLSQEGLLPGVYFNKVDLNSNISHQLNDKLKLGGKLSYTYSENSLPGSAGLSANVKTSVYRNINDVFPLELREDLSVLQDEIFRFSPRGWVEDYEKFSTENRVLGNLSLQYKFRKDIVYDMKFGGDYRSSELNVWQGVGVNPGFQRDGRYSKTSLNRFSYNIDNTISFRPKAKGSHRYSLLGGVVLNSSDSDRSTSKASNYSEAGQINKGRDFIGATIVEPTTFNFGPERLISFLGRVTYGFRDRYKVSASIRYDGSSKFSGKNRFGFFPAISAAWEAHKESFIQDSDLKIDQLKFRIGYGETGNQRVGSNLAILNYRVLPQGYADSDASLLTAYEKLNIPSRDLKWETQKQLNTGIDIGLLDSRLSITADAYSKQSDDLLNTLNIGGSAGLETIVVNQGSMLNRGFELAINGDVFRNENFTWNVFGTYSENTIQVQNLGLESAEFGAEGSLVGYFGRPLQLAPGNTSAINVYIEGKAPGLFFGYETDGILTKADIDNGYEQQEGFYKIVDKNQDGEINESDKVILGDPNPDAIYSFGTNMTYKGWSFSASFYGVVGNDIFNANYLTENFSPYNQWNNVRKDYVENRYRSDTQSGTLPDINLEKNDLERFSALDVAVADGSYLRLQNVSVGYNFSLDNSSIDKIKVFCSMSNVFTITNYTGVDPEISSLRFTPGVAGVDIGSPPIQSTLTIGGSITF